MNKVALRIGLALLALTAIIVSAWADQTAFTADGRTVILKDDFTWKYAEGAAATASTGACPLNLVAHRGHRIDLVCSCSAEATQQGAVYGYRTYTDNTLIDLPPETKCEP
jgi:hypothetical protein